MNETDLMESADRRALAYLASVNDRRVFPDAPAIAGLARFDEAGINVRVIAATNRDIDGLLQSGSFRRDLLERLVAVEIVVPPLRERRDEILPLAEFFINKYGRRYGRPLNPFSDRVRERLLSYEWPGNVRELEQLIKRFVVLQDESLVLQQLTSSAPGPRPALC